MNIYFFQILPTLFVQNYDFPARQAQNVIQFLSTILRIICSFRFGQKPKFFLLLLKICPFRYISFINTHLEFEEVGGGGSLIKNHLQCHWLELELELIKLVHCCHESAF